MALNRTTDAAPAAPDRDSDQTLAGQPSKDRTHDGGLVGRPRDEMPPVASTPKNPQLAPSCADAPHTVEYGHAPWWHCECECHITVTWHDDDHIWIATDDRHGCWASGTTQQEAQQALARVRRDRDATLRDHQEDHP